MAYDVAERKAYTGLEHAIRAIDKDNELGEIVENKEISQWAIEQNLNAGVLIAQGKEEEEKHYLDFFLLGLMQLACAAKALKAKDSHALENWLREMGVSIERGYRQHDSENAYKRRKNEESFRRSNNAKDAVSARHEENSKHARQHTEERFLAIARDKREKGYKISKRQIAFDIHRQLAKKHPRDEYDSKNEDMELKKSGWFFPKDKERFYNDWILPDCEKWMQQANCINSTVPTP